MGDSRGAAITEDGNLYIWCDRSGNRYGQVGNGTTDDCLYPIKILDDVKAVSLSENNSAAITNNGSLYCWGENSYGQVGNGSTEDQYTPVKILDNIISVNLGYGHSAAISEDGSLYCWGRAKCNGTDENKLTPNKVLDNITTVDLGDYHSGAITESGILYCWGLNSYGEIGNDANADVSSPIQINFD